MDWKTPPPIVYIQPPLLHPRVRAYCPENSFPLSSAGFEKAALSHLGTGQGMLRLPLEREH